ncbi:unnamed protein product [Rotaria sp. Silwood1]|nr:unnamed protein product [Rotaria sp. Silwood1]
MLEIFTKKTCALVFMPPQEISKLWVMIMDDYQDIGNTREFYDYITSTWIDDDALIVYTLWNYYDFKNLRTNNSLDRWHHRLNSDLNNAVHPHFYVFIHAIQNDYAYNSAILSRHLQTGTLSPWKKLFVNRNARLNNLEERFKQNKLASHEYLEKIMQLIEIKTLRIFWGFDNNLQDLYNNFNGSGINGPTYSSPGYNGAGACLWLSQASSQSVTFNSTFLNMAYTSFTWEVWLYANTLHNNNPYSDNAVFGQFHQNTLDHSLYIIIRNQRIYLGFFNDDVSGNQAYIYDYSTLTQYVYVNGYLDTSRSQAGPYQGTSG